MGPVALQQVGSSWISIESLSPELAGRFLPTSLATTEAPQWPNLHKLHLQWFYFQIKSHCEALRVRMSVYESGEIQFIPLTGGLEENRKQRSWESTQHELEVGTDHRHRAIHSCTEEGEPRPFPDILLGRQFSKMLYLTTSLPWTELSLTFWPSRELENWQG